MSQDKPDIALVSGDQGAALSSPLRLEIIGLFAEKDLLSIADMAERMGVRPGSLYHHVSILEDAGLLRRAGTRRKGKRDEALYELLEDLMGLSVDPEDEKTKEYARRTLASAFRMAERDFAGALESDHSVAEGPARNVFGTRVHLRASPKLLARVNKKLDELFDLVAREAAKSGEKGGDDDQFLSLTLALMPLKGRRPR